MQEERVGTVVKLKKMKDEVYVWDFRKRLRKKCSVQNQVWLDVVDGDWKILIESLMK